MAASTPPSTPSPFSPYLFPNFSPPSPFGAATSFPLNEDSTQTPKKRRQRADEESSRLFQEKRRFSISAEDSFPTLRRKRKDLEVGDDIEATQAHKRYHTDLDAQLQEMRVLPLPKHKLLSWDSSSTEGPGSLMLYKEPQMNYLFVKDPDLLRSWLLQHSEEAQQFTKELKNLPLVVYRYSEKDKLLPPIKPENVFPLVEESEGPLIEEVKDDDRAPDADSFTGSSKFHQPETQSELEQTNEMELDN
jgi:hypothetical protein